MLHPIKHFEIGMIFPPIPENELLRLQALYTLKVLDTPEDERFDWVTRFAAEKLIVPICLITLIDRERQWFKSTWGVDTKELPRNLSICAHAICVVKAHYPRRRVFEISDTHKDSRFFDHPLIVGEPKVRSYISFILQIEPGLNVGTLCLVDKRPRKFNEYEIDLIIELGKMTEELLIYEGRNSTETFNKLN